MYVFYQKLRQINQKMFYLLTYLIKFYFIVEKESQNLLCPGQLMASLWRGGIKAEVYRIMHYVEKAEIRLLPLLQHSKQEVTR